PAPSVRLEHQREIARMAVVELGARPFFQEIGIDRIGSQQHPAMLPCGALTLEAVELARELTPLLDEILLRLQPVVAGMRIGPEIRDDQRRPGVEAERAQGRAQSRAADHANHGRKMAPGALTSL